MKDSAVQPAAAPFLSDRLLHPLVHVVLILLLGLLAYANSFQAPFHYDDYKNMLEVSYVQDLGYLNDWSLVRQYLAGDHGFMMRFVGYLSFALNYALHGDAVVGYHAVNLAIHLVNALLVYSLVWLTLRTPYFETQGSTIDVQDSSSAFSPQPLTFLPLFTALLFVSHPVQTQAVTYIVQRIASLATLFCLATVVLYIQARLALDRQGWKGRAILWYAGSFCCALLAMKTKEIAFTLPLAVCIYEFMFFRGKPSRRLICVTPLLLTMLVIPLSMLLLTGTGGALGDVGSATSVGSDLTRAEYFFTELRVIVTYLRLLFLPVNQNLVYDYPVYRTLFTPPVFLSFLLLVALFGLAVYLAYRSRLEVKVSRLETQNSKLITQNLPFYRLIAFGMFWFFLTLSVESSIIPITDVIFEHRIYLPSVGAFLAFASFFAEPSTPGLAVINRPWRIFPGLLTSIRHRSKPGAIWGSSGRSSAGRTRR